MADVNGVSGAGNAAAGAANGQTAEQEAEFMEQVTNMLGMQMIMESEGESSPYNEMMNELLSWES